MGGVFNVSQLLINLNFTMSFSQKLQQKYLMCIKKFLCSLLLLLWRALTVSLTHTCPHSTACHCFCLSWPLVFFFIILLHRAFTLDRFQRFVKPTFKPLLMFRVDFNQKVKYSCNLNYTIVLYSVI